LFIKFSQFSGVGKVFLSYFSSSKQENYFEEVKCFAYTDSTITSLKKMRAEIITGISVSGATQRINAKRLLDPGEIVKEITKQVSIECGYKN
jgi:DNA-binding IclR family transcriptional regulator